MVVIMAKIRRQFSKEFKEEIVRQVVELGKSIDVVAKDHDLASSVIYGWVKQAKIDANPTSTGPLSSTERQELTALRKQLRES